MVDECIAFRVLVLGGILEVADFTPIARNWGGGGSITGEWPKTTHKLSRRQSIRLNSRGIVHMIAKLAKTNTCLHHDWLLLTIRPHNINYRNYG